MKKSSLSRKFFIISCLICLFIVIGGKNEVKAEESADYSYDVITKGMDWGPGNTDLVINLGEKVSGVTKDTFKVKATKDMTTPLDEKTGKVKKTTASKAIKVLNAYSSDKNGKRLDQSSQYITLKLEVHPDNKLTSPYNFNEETAKNTRVDVKYTINQEKDLKDKDAKKITGIKLTADNLNQTRAPQTEAFEQKKFSYKDREFGNIQLTYAAYQPKKATQKQPLVIVLHGLGEGGTDSEIPLLGNKVTALASRKIQSYFGQGGAQLLVPQTDTMWLDDGTGEDTTDGSSMYTRALMNLIKAYVKEHKDTVDADRIYIGGVSNGGYMTVKMLLADPDYFAAGFPISQAYDSSWLSDQELKTIKDVPMWFIQAENDGDVPFDKTSKPVVERLQKLGAKDTKLTAYDHVYDFSGAVKDKKGKPYHYEDHWSWIHAYNDDVADEQGNSLYQWLAQQTRK